MAGILQPGQEGLREVPVPREVEGVDARGQFDDVRLEPEVAAYLRLSGWRSALSGCMGMAQFGSERGRRRR